MAKDRAVAAATEYSLYFVEIDNHGAPLALRIARALSLMRQAKYAIAFRWIV
jgi:hypothetical protein